MLDQFVTIWDALFEEFRIVLGGVDNVLRGGDNNFVPEFPYTVPRSRIGALIVLNLRSVLFKETALKHPERWTQ